MRTNNYWLQRVLREQNLTKSINTIDKDLQRIYKRAYENLSIELKRLYWEILEAEGEVLPSHLYQYNRYYILMNKIQDELIKLGNTEQRYFERELTGVYEYNRKLINPLFNVELNKSAIETAIHTAWLDDVWSNRIWNNLDQLSAKVRSSVVTIFTTGESTDDFIKDLMKDFSVSYSRAKTLANTELAHYSTAATIDGYIDMGITKYKVITEKDCCEECNDLSNQVFDINDPTGYVPVHPNCRCSIMAVE